MKVSIFRKEHFNAAHRLHVESWTKEKNLEVFGKCNNPNFHGHNYELEVKLTGEIDPVTGYFMNLVDLKKIIHDKVVDAFDHKNFNLEIDEFKTLNPTVENIAIVIWDRLRSEIDESLELGVRLYETPRNYVEYSGPNLV